MLCIYFFIEFLSSVISINFRRREITFKLIIYIDFVSKNNCKGFLDKLKIYEENQNEFKLFIHNFIWNKLFNTTKIHEVLFFLFNFLTLIRNNMNI